MWQLNSTSHGLLRQLQTVKIVAVSQSVSQLVSQSVCQSVSQLVTFYFIHFHSLSSTIIHFNPLPSTFFHFTRFHPFSSTFYQLSFSFINLNKKKKNSLIHFHLVSFSFLSSFIQFHQSSSTFNNFHPLALFWILFRPPSPSFILFQPVLVHHFHPLAPTFMHLHPLSEFLKQTNHKCCY